MNRHERSISKLLLRLYPDFSWDPLKFSKAPRHYWSSVENQKKFLDELGKKIQSDKGVIENTKEAERRKEKDFWYEVPIQQVIDGGGVALIDRYHGSLAKLLENVYPDYDWDLRRFTKVPRNYWGSIENQRSRVEEIGRKVGIKEGDTEPWYKVSNLLFIEHGGASLLDIYKWSLPDLLKAVFPEYDWRLWKFKYRSTKVFTDKNVLNEMLVEVENQLQIKSPEDWKRIRLDELNSMNVGRYFTTKKKKEEILAALRQKYPQDQWEEEFFRLNQKGPSS